MNVDGFTIFVDFILISKPIFQGSITQAIQRLMEFTCMLTINPSISEPNNCIFVETFNKLFGDTHTPFLVKMIVQTLQLYTPTVFTQSLNLIVTT